MCTLFSTLLSLNEFHQTFIEPDTPSPVELATSFWRTARGNTQGLLSIRSILVSSQPTAAASFFGPAGVSNVTRKFCDWSERRFEYHYTMSSNTSSFTSLDYILFALTLSISASIGFFYAFIAWKKKEGIEAYLTGSRRMPLIPTACSLLVSFISGISIISYPAEVYTHGLVFAWSAIGAAFAPVVSGFIILPVLHKMRNTVSIYAYLEYRFGSTLLRTYGSLLYQFNTLFYLSVVLYAPSIALAGVTGIDVRVLIISVGLVCTMYTAIGGLKAVVWTDFFQGFLIYAGLLALAIKGTSGAGGIGMVFHYAKEYGRLEKFWNIDPNPCQYMTIWMGFFGGLFSWLVSFGCDQTALQRYYSLPSIKKARLAAFLNAPCLITVMTLVVYIGLTMVPKYVHCDPRHTARALQKDQLVISYMLETLGGVYGLPGLFVACIFSGTLSSVSSGINSLSAVFLEDVVKPIRKNRNQLTDKQATTITKIVGAVYGFAAIGLAFLAGPLGGIFKAVTSAYGALGGPLVGMFLLGIIFPSANWIGALCGTLLATGISLWIFIGCVVYNVDYPQLSVYTDSCIAQNISLSDFIGTTPGLGLTSDPTSHSALFSPPLYGIEKIYAISYVVYPCIGVMLTIVLGLGISVMVSWVSRDKANNNDKVVYAYTYWSTHDSAEEKWNGGMNSKKAQLENDSIDLEEI